MDDPQKIPDDSIEKPEGSTGSPVDPDSPLVTPGDNEEVEVVIDLGGTDKYPEDAPFTEKIDPIDDELVNIDTVQVYYREDPSSPWEEITDGVSHKSEKSGILGDTGPVLKSSEM